MIKVGRLPGRLYSVEYTDRMTVGEAVAQAKQQAEEAGKTLETMNCQIRVAGREVSERELIDDNAVVTITQKIKGNTSIYVDGLELLANRNTTAKEILDVMEKDFAQYQLMTEYDNVALDNGDYILNFGTSFRTEERVGYISSEDECPEENCCNCGCCDYDEEDEEDDDEENAEIPTRGRHSFNPFYGPRKETTITLARNNREVEVYVSIRGNEKANTSGVCEIAKRIDEFIEDALS